LNVNENAFISPFSVAAVLGMIHAGAKGQTAAQMKEAMYLSNVTDEKIGAVIGNLVKNTKDTQDVTLASANQLYLAHFYPLAEAYEHAIKEHFGASPQNVDFGSDETRAQINKWVEEFTLSKIKDILPSGSLNSLTKLVLVNAIYFKGNWLRKFDAALTKPEPFYLGSNDNAIDVHMMHIDGDFRTGDIKNLDARVVELPYVGRKLSMFIILPNQVDGLKALESHNLEKLLDEVDAHIANAKVHVAIPKFKLEAEVRMKDVLISMGMSHLFDGNAADLSGVSGKNDLYVSNVFHKAFIEVNEEGSEAAAATAGVMMMRCLVVPPPPPPPFIADHPFYYYIRDNVNNVVLFAGRMAKPHLA